MTKHPCETCKENKPSLKSKCNMMRHLNINDDCRKWRFNKKIIAYTLVIILLTIAVVFSFIFAVRCECEEAEKREARRTLAWVTDEIPLFTTKKYITQAGNVDWKVTKVRVLTWWNNGYGK